MHSDRPDVVRVGLEGLFFGQSVVVVDSNVGVVRARNNPLLAGDEARRSDREVGGLEAAD